MFAPRTFRFPFKIGPHESVVYHTKRDTFVHHTGKKLEFYARGSGLHLGTICTEIASSPESALYYIDGILVLRGGDAAEEAIVVEADFAAHPPRRMPSAELSADFFTFVSRGAAFYFAQDKIWKRDGASKVLVGSLPVSQETTNVRAHGTETAVLVVGRFWDNDVLYETTCLYNFATKIVTNFSKSKIDPWILAF